MHKNYEGYPDPTEGEALNGVRWEELQRLREKEHGIKRGTVITIYIREEDESRKKVYKKRRARILEYYRHIVLLELQGGERRGLNYWQLNKYMQPPEEKS